MSRDVHGLGVLFVMPAVFILIMSLALRDAFQPSLSAKATWQVWDEDGTAESAALIARLPPPDSRVAVKEKADLGRALEGGNIQLGLEIAEGYAEALADTANREPHVTVLAEPGMPPSLIAAFKAEVARAIAAERVAAMLRPLQALAAPGGADEAGVDALTDEAILDVKFHRGTTVDLTAVQQSVPAWLVFAMFFVVIPLSTIFIAEKQHGTLPRLRSLRVSTATLVAGKVVPFYAVNLVQTALMLAVGRYVVPLAGGDALQLEVDWLALWAIASSVSLAAIGFALAVATVARTTEQATTIGGVSNILFGALGGVMVPRLVMPAAMQKAAMLSPMAWGLEGFLDVFVRDAHLADLALPVGSLLGFGALCLGVATWRLRSVS